MKRAPIAPERVQAAIGKLEQLAEDTIARNGTPGLGIVVIHQGRVVYLKGFGVREAGQPGAIDAETVFQLASVSKPITATVLAGLVGEGRVGWDDRVIDHDPGFELSDPYVTRELRLRDLLCHRSGLPDHAGDLLEDMGYGRAEILRRLRYLPLGAFRAEYNYTNFGYSEAAFAAAKACDMPWEELAREILFAPLGMKATSYRFADYAKNENRARLHVLVDGKWTAKNTRDPDAQAPAGGVSSTLPDVAAWLLMLLANGQADGKQVIAAAALAETHKPQFVLNFDPVEGRVGSYGVGWNVGVERGGRVFLRHSGGFDLGMRTEVSLLPAEGLAIAVLSNAGPNGVPEGLTESFFDWAIYGELSRDWLEFANRMFAAQVEEELGAGHDYSKPPAEAQPPQPPGAYVGKFSNDYYGTIEVVEQARQLVLRLGPRPMEFVLRPWSRDNFVYDPPGENSPGPSAVQMTTDPFGRADRVIIENLDSDGLGTFKRVVE